MSEYVLEMKNITKVFPGVRALDNATLLVNKGEIHALVGENGAGKSTLMKILSGLHPFGSYRGDIILDNNIQKFQDIADSQTAGITIIYQELALVKHLSIAENMFLGHEPCTTSCIIDWNETYRATSQALQYVGLSLPPSTPIADLGMGAQQLVEIAKALARKSRVLILDEPTASLTVNEAANLLEILIFLKNRGVTCIYISHRLHEVQTIADRITVLRDGKTVCSGHKADMPNSCIIHNMVGRETTTMYPRRSLIPGDTAIEVKNWTVRDPTSGSLVCSDISFKACKKEILGIAGLIGAGRTELVTSLFGAYGNKVTGELYINYKKAAIHGIHDAIQKGLALVSEDRKRHGLALRMDIKSNCTMACLEKISRFGVIDNTNEIILSTKYLRDLGIKVHSIEQLIRNLSGGNQQKVVLAKWLLTKPKVLLLDEPTRGVDIGARIEIYNIMNRLAEQGVCIILVSSILPEVIGMSDRILVIHEGRIAAEIPRSEATEEKLMYYATGGRKEHARNEVVGELK